MKVSILSLGCKVNQAESLHIEGSLRAHGWSIVDLDENPDYCIINTCSVTSKSDYQSRQLIRRAHRAGSKVIVTGCYSELNKETVGSMDGVVNTVINNIDKLHISNMLAGSSSCDTLDLRNSQKSRFFLKVQDGCNNSCSYCIIPLARGRSRSMVLEEAVQQVDMLSDTYSEIILTGIHLGAYGYDLRPNVTLADLVRTILRRTSIKRLRLSSLECREIDGELIDLFQDRRICNHLHIPIQSGDEQILIRMNRNYTPKEISRIFNTLYAKIPNVALGTDIIAGFPGESDINFDNSLNLLKSLPLSYIHVFPFSARPGTEAAGFKPRVDSSVKAMRCEALRWLSKRKKEQFMRANIGQTVDLLIEEGQSENAITGTTSNYLKVRALMPSAPRRSIVSVRIAGIDGEVLTAHPMSLR